MVRPLQYACSTQLTLQSACRGNVEVVLDQKDERGAKQQLLEDLELIQVLDRDVEHLSGASSGQLALQRRVVSWQCTAACSRQAGKQAYRQAGAAGGPGA